MKRCAIFLTCVFAGVLDGAAQTAYTIRFERDLYEVQPGQSFLANVLMEPQSTSGLYSYAILVQMDALKAQVAGPFGITVPDDLEFNGVVGAGAFRSVGADFAGVKGTVDFFGQPVTYYAGSLLGTFAITDVSGTLGEYTLSVAGFNTLGPTEQLFVNGTGQVLDSLITFGSATVRVVPEPASVALGLLGGAGLWVTLARRSNRPGFRRREKVRASG